MESTLYTRLNDCQENHAEYLTTEESWGAHCILTLHQHLPPGSRMAGVNTSSASHRAGAHVFLFP